VQKPAQYDEKLAMAATNQMSAAMAVHLLFGTWFFGCKAAAPILHLHLFCRPFFSSLLVLCSRQSPHSPSLGVFLCADIDADFINISPMIPSSLGARIAPIIDLTIGYNGETMLADRVKKAPSFFMFMYLILWFLYELVMRYVNFAAF
jgi:hypothetical protein